MGSDPAPFFTNLFLFYFKYKWVRNVQRSDLSRARKFATIFWFIGDLLTMNDGGEFACSLEEIYPPELELNKENEGISNATLLDLNIETDGVKFTTSLYNKRNAFPFSILRMPFLCSNTPSRMFYISLSTKFSVRPEFLQLVKVLFHLLKPWLEECSGKVVNTFAFKKVLGKIYARHPESFGHLFSDVSQLFQNLVSSC